MIEKIVVNFDQLRQRLLEVNKYRPVFGVPSTQTLVKIYNNSLQHIFLLKIPQEARKSWMVKEVD